MKDMWRHKQSKCKKPWYNHPDIELICDDPCDDALESVWKKTQKTHTSCTYPQDDFIVEMIDDESCAPVCEDIYEEEPCKSIPPQHKKNEWEECFEKETHGAHAHHREPCDEWKKCSEDEACEYAPEPVCEKTCDIPQVKCEPSNPCKTIYKKLNPCAYRVKPSSKKSCCNRSCDSAWDAAFYKLHGNAPSSRGAKRRGDRWQLT